MKNKLHKCTILLSSTILAAILFSACSGKNSITNITPLPSPTVSDSPASSSETTVPQVLSRQGEGMFVGLSDSHTIEITVDGKTAAYQLGEGSDSALATLKEGDIVSFEYTETSIDGDTTTKVLMITKIEKSPENTSPKELPVTKEFKLKLEGNQESRTGKLAKGEGYALYIFEQFNFDAASNRLTMNADNNYNVEISKLPVDFKVDAIKKDAMEELADLDDVQAMDPKDLTSMISGVDLVVIGHNDKLTKEVIVKTVDGASFLFKLNIPSSEPSEGFVPLAFASIDSIVTQ